MGGILDATNAIPNEAPIVSALTTIDLGHRGFLGNTVAEVTEGCGLRGGGFVFGSQRFPGVEGPRTGISGLVLFPCFPQPLSGKLPLHVHTNY